MLRSFLLGAALLGLACAARPVAADELKTADEIVAKYIQAIGGREKMDAIKTIKSTGKSVFQGGMEASLAIEFKRPNKVRIEFTFQGMTGTQAFDGESGWFIMPFTGKTDPEKMSPDQVKEMESQADFDGPLVDYQKKGHKLELMGKDEAEGSSAYKLKVTKKNGDVEYHFLDAEQFLPIKVAGKREFQGMQMDYEVAFGDYKAVAGMLFAHSIRQKAGQMGENTMIFEKVEANAPIEDERFVMPKPKPPEPTKEATPSSETGKPENKDKPNENKKP